MMQSKYRIINQLARIFGSVMTVNSPSEHPDTKNREYLEILILFTQASLATLKLCLWGCSKNGKTLILI